MAITLDDVNTSITLVTSTAATIDVTAEWVDVTTTAFTPGDTNTAVSSAATTPIVAAPAASTQRGIKRIGIVNKDAALSCVITVRKLVTATNYQIYSTTLLAGESVEWADGGGWIKYSSGGVLQTVAAAGPVDVQTFMTPGSSSWTKPTSFTPSVVMVVVDGGGGGGGGGGGVGSNTGLGGAGGIGGVGAVYVISW